MQHLLVGGAIILVGFIAAWALGNMVRRAAAGRLTAIGILILYRAVTYSVGTIALLLGLQHMGVDLGVVLGAAGILTVAIGFASQTVASNVISGLFLIGDRPFVLGDVITVGTETGEVRSVDLLSVKLRTFDNRLVRVPNELLLKTTFTNNTHYPIRRIDLQLRFNPSEDLDTFKAILERLASGHPLCLDEPRPIFQVTGYNETAVLIQFSVWTHRENLLEARSDFQRLMLQEFRAAGIKYPYLRLRVDGATDAANGLTLR